MGRPKGKRDSTPRTRRRKDGTVGGAAPERLTARERSIKRQVRDVLKDLVWNDWYIKIGLGVSGIQLAVTFTYITGSFWASALSVISAVGKAAFVEAGVWLINRTISHARTIRVHWGWQGILWTVLFTLMFISTRANLRYEWEKKAETKYPKGMCILRDEDGACVRYEKININAANVGQYLSSDEQSEAWQRGGLIPLLVFASIIIGRVMLASKDGFERDEMQRLKTAIRGVRHRERRKKEDVVLAAELGAVENA